jgi:pyridoxal phosphate enzyme (YggS family)
MLGVTFKMIDQLSINLAEVRARVKEAACRLGKRPEDIEIVAVTKNVDIKTMQQAQALGIKSFGENRVQEFIQKYPAFYGSVGWHFIGHLQTNKAKQLIGKVDLIHSLDRLSLAREIQERAKEKNILVKTLLQLNISKEDTKFGLEEKDVLPFLEALMPMENLRVLGLMTMAPISDQPEDVRPIFAALRRMAERISSEGFPLVEMQYLSMGMSQDYYVAIEEGANIIRIGSAIFGQLRKGDTPLINRSLPI